MKKYRLHWLFIVMVLSLLYGAIYKVGLIGLDSTLYDDLTTQAVDKAWQTALSAEKDGVVKAPFLIKVNVENQLSSFMTVYDKDKKVVGSSGVLDEQTPELPTEYLDNTNLYVRNYFTWEPKPGVHLAGVSVTMGDKGYVMAGRNMQETDRQTDRLVRAVVVAWGASVLLATAGLVVITKRR